MTSKFRDADRVEVRPEVRRKVVFQKSALGAGLAVCLLAGAAFYAGHELWPRNQIVSSLTQNVATPPAVAPNGSGAKVMALSEDTVARVAKKCSASVVNIDTAFSVVIPESPYRGEFGQFLQPEFLMPRRGMELHQLGKGSGLIIRSDGYILTNNHVVQNADQIRVTLSDNRTLDGKLVGRDTYTDLALIKVDATNLPVAQLGNVGHLQPGDWAIAIGNPVGLSHTVTLGIVSALARSLAGTQVNVDLIQTDAAINPGNSGGPLLNIRGEVIGINTAIRSDAQNIGFAIPIDIAQDVAKQLLEKGKIDRAWVGIHMQDVNERNARSLGVASSTKGVAIVDIASSSQALKAGLERGDIIQRIDGQLVDSARDIQSQVRKHRPGDKVRLSIRRGKEIVQVQLTLAEFPEDLS